MQCRLVIVINFSKISHHNLPKNVIHTVQYFFSTPEVFMKINPLFWSFFQIIRVKFFHKKLWSGQPEAINTLLDISHHKNIIFSFRNTGNTGQNRLLDQITILIFVNHNLPELILIFLCNLRRFKPFFCFFCQDLKCKLLHI